jgi:hypothetical protein
MGSVATDCLTTPEQDPRLGATVFVVEATSFEQSALWQQHHEEWPWEQDNPGWLVTCGELDGLPVCFSLTFNRIMGRLVAFWDPTSRMVDHEMIEAWFDRHCSPKWDRGTRPARANAMNFHHCIEALLEAKAP